MPYVEDNLDELKKNDANINVQPIPRHYLKVGILYYTEKYLSCNIKVEADKQICNFFIFSLKCVSIN